MLLLHVFPDSENPEDLSYGMDRAEGQIEVTKKEAKLLKCHQVKTERQGSLRLGKDSHPALSWTTCKQLLSPGAGLCRYRQPREP